MGYIMSYDSLELKQVLDGLSELFDAVLHGEKVNENSKNWMSWKKSLNAGLMVCTRLLLI